MSATPDLPDPTRRLWLPAFTDRPLAFLSGDLAASVAVWALLIPQALAYAQIAGLPPEYGLYAAIGGMLGYAVLGVSRQLNVGPEATVGLLSAAAVTPLLAGDPSRMAPLSAALAVMVGLVCLAMGLLRLGFLTRLLSRPVLVGYLAGTGLTMIASQMDKLLGVDVESYDAATAFGQLVQAAGDANLVSVAIGVGVIALILVLRAVAPRLPAYLIAVAVATLVTSVLQLDTTEGVAVVGSIKAGLPPLGLPVVGWSDVAALALPAVGIGLLVFADSGITVRVLGARSHETPDTDRHLLGMGVAGVLSGLVQGFAVNGSASRSFAADDSGGRTQLVSVVATVLVALTLLFLAPLFAAMPLAALGGITIVVAIGLIDLPEVRRIARFDRIDLALTLLTTLIVIFVGVLAGVLVVVMLSLLDAARRAAAPHAVELRRVPGTESYRSPEFAELAGPAGREPGIVIYRFDATLFFANVDVFTTDIKRLLDEAPDARTVVVNAEAITSIDSTAVQSVSDLLDELDRRGVALALARVKGPLLDQLTRSGLLARIGSAAIYTEVHDAVDAVTRATLADRPDQ